MKTMTSTCLGLFALAAALTGCAGSSESNDDTSSAEDQTADQSAEETAEEASEAYNEADAAYIGGMIPHHQQATEMSEILLEKDDVEAEVRTLAEDIRDAQEPEIRQMEGWLVSWGHEDMDGMGDMDDMDHSEMDQGQMNHEGMMSEEALSELEDADGAQASTLFMEQMIVHHEGAVASAEEHLDEGENQQALELSENIIAEQSAEIEEMESLLDSR